MYIVELENTITHQFYQYECTDKNDGQKLYYLFNINTLELDSGEYNLTVYEGDEVIHTDLLKIGDFNPTTLQYKTGANTYISIELDAKIGDKTEHIIDINTTIYPDDGYDGMSSVNVDASFVYDDGYNSGMTFGYDSGYYDGYQTGHNEGSEEGFENGYKYGMSDQKQLLESTAFTENGIYTKENGWNEVGVNVPQKYTDEQVEELKKTAEEEGYRAGYDNGHLNGSEEGFENGYNYGIADGTANAEFIIGNNARVLDITKNGTYVSKYSEDIKPDDVTGIWDDGEEFYNYGTLDGIVYDTGVRATPNSRIEFWYKNEGNVSSTNIRPMVGAQISGNFIFKIAEYSGGYRYEYGDQTKKLQTGSFTMPEGWNHIIMSKNEGVVINGTQVATLDVGQFVDGKEYAVTFYINAAFYNEINYNPNGYYGMVKIDDNIFIPTIYGMRDYKTDLLLGIVKNGNYTFTEMSPQKPEGDLIKTVNVNIVPKINMQQSGIKLAFSSFSKVPEWVDWEGITDMYCVFRECTSLNTLPIIDTSKVTNMYAVCENDYHLTNGNELLKWDFGNVKNFDYAFNKCHLDKIPSIDTKNVTSFSYSFANMAKYLKEVEPINTSNATSFSYMFYDFSTDSVLEKLPEFDCTKVTNMNYMFAYSGYQNKLPKLIDCGGWKNLKTKWNDGYGLNHCPNLSYQSCINILNGLYDFTGNGETPTSSQGQLKVHSNFLTTVGDEISIGTNKGWVISQ